MTSTELMTIETVERQKRYVELQKAKGGNLSVIFADAFLRGMRDLGYKSPASAIAELVDNAFQAAADSVKIRFGFKSDNKNQAKADMLAICDTGNGMIPEMISYAVRWGGTDRENDRKGLGRYGYGLPSAAVSLAKRYTVYSKPSGGDWHSVTVDLEKLADAATDFKKTAALLSPKLAELPTWLLEAEDLTKLKSGTVVVLEDIDRLRKQAGWVMAKVLQEKLLKDMGVIYRHWIPEHRISINGITTEPVDPLFLMEHGRFYNETSVLAQRVEARTFEVDTEHDTKGTISIRASFLPPNFQLANPLDPPGSKNNKRAPIMREYNGLLVCRERRHIDTVQPRWTKFQNNDANVKIEINFDPELDEFFGITTAKQQIVIDDTIWEKLQHSGKNGGALMDLVKDIRRRFEEVGNELKAQTKNVSTSKDQTKPSILALEKSAKFKEKAFEPSEEQKTEAQGNLEKEAEARARITQEPKEKELQKLIEKTKKQSWEIKSESIPEGPFYRPKRLGEQKVLIINTDHPFYSKIYEAAPEAGAALEVLLLVLAERELESKEEAEKFYKAERQKWSERLRYALNELSDDQTLADKAASVAEKFHVSEEEESFSANPEH